MRNTGIDTIVDISIIIIVLLIVVPLWRSALAWIGVTDDTPAGIMVTLVGVLAIGWMIGRLVAVVRYRMNRQG